MNHTTLKQADIHNFDCLYDYNNPGFYLLGVGEWGGKLPPQTLQLPPPPQKKIMLFCTMFMSENIVENALRFNLRAPNFPNFSGGACHQTPPRPLHIF